ALYQRPVQRLSDHSLSLVVYGLGRMGAQVDGQWLAACLEELADAYTALVDLEPQLAAVWGDNFEQLLPKGQLQAAGVEEAAGTEHEGWELLRAWPAAAAHRAEQD
ncbi:hypothetical protein HaLaN_06935, partial [Haematococcus lacustris]